MSFGTVNGVPFGVGVTPNSVGTAEIVDGQVMIADLANDSVTPAKLQDTGAFTVDQLNATSGLSGGQVAINGSGYLISVQSASDAVFIRSSLNVDIEDRFAVLRSGAMSWGGGALPTDTNLYRSAANTLKTDDAFIAAGGLTTNNGIDVASGSVNMTGDGNLVWPAIPDGYSPIQIKRDTSGFIDFQVFSDGEILWGDGTVAADTNLYRSAADTLKTDDSLIVDANLTVNGNAALGSAATDTVGMYGVASVVQAAAIAAPTAPGVVYSQAEAQSMETAVNAIRVALAGIGITA
jgi:hypothetical protein